VDYQVSRTQPYYHAQRMIYRLHTSDRTIDFYVRSCAELYLVMYRGQGWIEAVAEELTE